MANLSVKTKLVLVFSFFGALVLGTAGLGYFSSAKILHKLGEVSGVHLPAVRYMTLADMMHDGLRATAYRALYLADSKDTKALEEVSGEVKEMSDNLRNYIGEIDKLEIHAETREAINASRPEIERYIKVSQELVRLSVAGQKDEAVRNVPELQETFESLEEKLGALGEMIEKDADESRAQAVATSNPFGSTNGAVLLIFLIVGLAMSIGLLKNLISTLGNISQRLKQTAEEVASSARQSTDSAASLSEASHEQAASIQETMASVAEISAMVDQNAESARRVKSSVDQNTIVIEDGTRNANEMLQAIESIRDTNNLVLGQMEENNKEFKEIVKVILAIGDKTKVINDIVFQTKLLSFNASVEAARAGEHGKGFAVVAEEVGSLAQMSGNAAKEITEMLSASVEKVNGIVTQSSQRMSHLIETGRKKVSEGQSTAHKCHEALQAVSSNAKQIASMINEVSVASGEQAHGIQEINKAISQLDHVTQTNTAIAQKGASQSEILHSGSEILSGEVNRLTSYVLGEQDQHEVAPARSVSASGNVIALNSQSASKRTQVSKRAVGSSEVPASTDKRFGEF